MIYDIAIIGAGPGGYVAAIRGAQLGGRICLIEERELGGTCLNRGCIPSKAFLESAARIEALGADGEFGVKARLEGFDLAVCADRKNRVVRRLVGGIETLLKGQGVEVVRGKGTLASSNRIRVTEPGRGEREVEARAVVVATGSRPAEIPGVTAANGRVVTSDEIWDLEGLPARMAVIGGGVVGCEISRIFAAFGTRVTVLEAMDRLLESEEKEVSRAVRKGLEERGVEVRTGARVAGVETGHSGVLVTVEGHGEVTFDCAALAIGRRPNSGGLGLPEIGVALDGAGKVTVGEGMESAAPGVYAVGDVVGRFYLAHVATSQARVAVHNCMGGKYRMDYGVIPYAVFTSPEVASVGAKEKELEHGGTPYEVGRFSWASAGKPLCMGQPEGFVKLLSHKETGRILGATVAGVHAAEVVAEVAVAMRTGDSVADLVGTIHIHPTVSEVILEAGEDTLGLSIHKPPKRPAKKV